MTLETSKSAETLIGGTLRANDPRRFLVEMMVGAVHADGHVDERETALLERMLREHELFSGLPNTVHAALLESARDALVFAGGATARLEKTALALPWRLHRLAAYAMACELVAADEIVTGGEEQYLRALRRKLVIGGDEAASLLGAAREGAAMTALEELRVQSELLLPKAIRLCVANWTSTSELTGDEINRIDDAFSRMLDFQEVARVPRERIARMAAELPASPGDRCLELGSRITDYADRYWAVTYALAAGPNRRWQSQPFLKLLRLGLEISERAMERAVSHAARIAAG